MLQHQSADAIRELVCRVMATTFQYFKPIWSIDECARAFRRRATDRVVVVAPDIQRRNLGRADGFVPYAARAIPRQGRLHRFRIADDGQMAFDRRLRHAIGPQPGAEPFGIVRQIVGPRGWIQEPRMVA